VYQPKVVKDECIGLVMYDASKNKKCKCKNDKVSKMTSHCAEVKSKK